MVRGLVHRRGRDDRQVLGRHVANGVASTGVDGLRTIVPIAAIRAWYDYSRSNGVRHNVTHYPPPSRAITQNQTVAALGVVPPSRTDLCAGTERR